MQSSNAQQSYVYNRPIDRRHDISRIRAREYEHVIPQPVPAEPRQSKPKQRKKPPKEFDRIKQNLPTVTKKGNIFYIYENERGQYRIPRPIIISLVVIFVCAVVTVATQVHLSSIERQLSAANRQLARIEEASDAVASQIGVPYSNDVIGEIAITRLGMTFPDQSQIIEIYVPRISHVEFNTVSHFMPRENYFWRDIGTFINGMLDRVFGG